MSKRILLVLVVLVFGHLGFAQELNCTVSVISPRIQSSDKRIFTTLQTAIMEFVNNTKWTQDKFKNEEKIECSIQIEIVERVGTDEFKGTIQVSSRRAVFGTSYNFPILKYKDVDFDFIDV